MSADPTSSPITIRVGTIKDAATIAVFNIRMAMETENVKLDPNIIERGVKRLFDDESRGTYYVAEIDGKEVARVQFQCGPRNEPGSTAGVTHMAMIALLLHPLRAFQEGPFKSRHNALAITALEEALNWMHARARDRAQRGVLGHAKP